MKLRSILTTNSPLLTLQSAQSFRSGLWFRTGPSTLLRTGLLAVLLLVSCAPAAASEPAQPEALAQPAPVENEPVASVPTATIAQPEAAPTEAMAAEAASTEAPTEVPQVVATSRGPNLEASDPAMVSLNGGELQFVEFFRFT